MSKKNVKGLTAKDIDEISERLYKGPTNPSPKKQDEATKQVLTKEKMEELTNRLFQKDPQSKKKELAEKGEQARQKDRPENMGYQAKEKNDIEEVTKRLFIADYVNRNVPAGGKAAPDKTVTAEERDAIVNRLYIANYSNKNIAENKAFYDTILNKKKATEKVMNRGECEETAARLYKMVRPPAESNKELRGVQTYMSKGIYGTYAMTAPQECLMAE